jgi:PLP dependent protein
MSSGEIARNIELVRQKVATQCQKNGVDPASITIVGITKTFGAKEASEGVRCGVIDLGENKVQEAAAKIKIVEPRPIWHMVGHLQKNKTMKAVETFDVIQSVDSQELAQMISDDAGKLGKKMTVYLQVNSSNEPMKTGFDPSEILKFVEHLKGLPNLNIAGLMTIGPLTDDAKKIEKSFAMTRNLFERIRDIIGPGFSKLSMGMSGDYVLALDHGANVLRIGTAIFGERKIDK